MKPRTKFLIGGALVLGVSGFLMASSIRDTGVYYLTPAELTAKLAADPTFHDAGVKVGARVVPGSVQRLPGGKDYAFRVTDGSVTFPVVGTGREPRRRDSHRGAVALGRAAHGRMGDHGVVRWGRAPA